MQWSSATLVPCSPVRLLNHLKLLMHSLTCPKGNWRPNTWAGRSSGLTSVTILKKTLQP